MRAKSHRKKRLRRRKWTLSNRSGEQERIRRMIMVEDGRRSLMNPIGIKRKKKMTLGRLRKYFGDNFRQMKRKQFKKANLAHGA
jgi:hypothetical protein